MCQPFQGGDPASPPPLACPPSIGSVHTPGPGLACRRPLALTAVPAGFPSPAEDYVDCELDLNQHLVRNPAATFFVRVAGDSMLRASIHDRDILVVDRSLEARNHSVVVAVVHGEMTVKRLRMHGGQLWLIPENTDFPPLEITAETDFEIWGVVTHVIHSLAGG